MSNELSSIPDEVPVMLRNMVQRLYQLGYRLIPGPIWTVEYPANDKYGMQVGTLSGTLLHAEVPRLLQRAESIARVAEWLPLPRPGTTYYTYQPKEEQFG